MTEEYKGTQTLQSFAPNWSDPDLLEKTLVGRRDLADRLEELAIDGADGPNKHQRLIIGPRGSGKTHVIKVLHNRLWRNEAVRKKMLIAYLIEDELGVATFLDFLVRVLRAVARWHPEHKGLEGDLARLADYPLEVAEARALDLLLEAAKDRTILILMENLGTLFDKQTGFGLEGQQALRDLVQQRPRFMLFATAQALIQGVQKHNAPFFGFFAITHLRKLTLEEAGDLLGAMAMARAYEDDKLANFLKTEEGRGRVRAVYRFTGGNHRLLVTFFDFLTAYSLTRLSEQFVKGLNPLRPYYQEQMRNLSAQQQKIVQHLSIKRDPQSVKEIARGCLSAPNVVSSQLKGLLDKGFVSRIPKGRESYYEIAEFLFRIVYEADLEQAGAPVRLFVDFLSNYYTAREIQLRRMGFSLLAKHKIDIEQRLFLEEADIYRLALDRSGGAYEKRMGETLSSGDEEPLETKEFFNLLQREKAYNEILMFAPHFEPSGDASVYCAEAAAHIELGDVEQAKEKAQKAIERNPDDFKAHIVLSKAYSRDKKTRPNALEHAQKACELARDETEETEGLENLGRVNGRAGYHEVAWKLFERLTALRPDNAEGWFLRGLAGQNLGRTQEAETAYQKALELNSENADTIQCLGALTGNIGRHDEALRMFERLTELRPNDSKSWSRKGLALANLGRSEEAESVLRKALSLDPNNEEAIHSLGILKYNVGNYAEAMDLFEKLVMLNPEDAENWSMKGLILGNLSRMEEAGMAFEKAVRMDPENVGAILNLGIMKGKTGNHEEALKLFERSIKLSPDDPNGWRNKGFALVNLGRMEEAMAAYRKALELNPMHANAILELGALEAAAEKYEEALKLFKNLTALCPNDTKGWNNLGFVLANLDLEQEAEEAYKKVIELDPKNVTAYQNLGALKGKAGRHEEALVLFDKFTKWRPTDAEGWFNKAVALQELGRVEEARAAYQKTLELNPNNATAVKNLAILEYVAGNHEKALRLFEEITTLHPNETEGHVLLGLALQNQGRMEEAEYAYKKALELDSEHADVIQNLGALKDAAGNHEEALRLFERLTTLRPDHTEGWHSMGLALANLGRMDEAEGTYQKALKLDPNNFITLNSMGELQRTRKNYKEAMEYYRRALEAEPDNFLPIFNKVSALLALDRIDEALDYLDKALQAVKDAQSPDSDKLIIQSFHENLMELFENASPMNFKAYLNPALETVQRFEGFLEKFSQGLSLTVFELLKKNEAIDQKRFEAIAEALEEAAEGKIEISVHLRLLRVGIDHFCKKDGKALMRLPREERLTFIEELGLEEK